MTRPQALWIAVFVACAAVVGTSGCQRTNGGHVVVAVGMSVDEIERASTDLGRWIRQGQAIERGRRVSGEVEGVRLRHPATGRDIELGPSRVSMYITDEGVEHGNINPQPEERCGSDYAGVVARLLAGGFATKDGRAFDVHFEEQYELWRPYWAEEPRIGQDLPIQLLRDDAVLEVRFRVDPSGTPHARSARDACFIGVWLRRP